jgi:hypothetical protein
MTTDIDPMETFLAFERLTANAGKGKDYPCRERIPEPLLHYADWFVSETGIQPDRKVINGWIKEFTYWQDKELEVIDLENAYSKSGNNNNFMVTSPFSLSGVAIAMKARMTIKQRKYTESESLYACPVCKQITCRCE